jgi:uridine kinase
MELTAALFDLCKSVSQPIIAIDGPAGAGKTTLSEHLTAALSLKYKCAVIHMDSLYNGWDSPFDHHLRDSLLQAITAHKSGQGISLPRFDWQSNKFVSGENLPPSQLLILEGVGSSQRAVRPSLAATIWIDIDPKSGLERVLQRDGEAISEQMQQWLVIQEQHFRDEDSKNAADFELTT